MRVTAVLTVRNEGAFLLEWLAHHRAIGITDFLVFSNDCSDGTDAMLDRLQAMGWLTHVRNPGPHDEGPHWAALKQADRHPLVKQADWLIVIDIDEFINVHVGNRTLVDLVSALPGATAIALSWRMFGNSGVVRYEDAPVTETFTRAAPRQLNWPWRAAMFKTLFRNDGSYGKLGVHRPRSPKAERMADQRWFDGSGNALPPTLHTERVFLDPGRDRYRLVQLNHYALGAVESFLLKSDRGNAFANGEPLNVDYWVDRNFAQEEDRSILQADSRKIRADLQSDPVLKDLHRAAVAWRHERFRILMAEEPWRALFGRLLMTPPSRALSREEAESVWKNRKGR
ncbi:MAG: glycosyltransferase family 2 protein [Tabrizicola sp.]|nr:glycosyltransferase family 2 protein [Tabrizicola sp.]